MCTMKNVLLLLSLMTSGNALRCYSSNSYATGRNQQQGYEKDCDGFKWCSWSYDDRMNFPRGCDSKFEVICDQMGSGCVSPPPKTWVLNDDVIIEGELVTKSSSFIIDGSKVPAGRGATACCCRIDLCNGSPPRHITSDEETYVVVFVIVVVVVVVVLIVAALLIAKRQ
jgi:hypothetical protein